MRTVVALLAFAALATAAPVPKEINKQTDPERFVGTWDTVVSESNGQPYSKARWTFDDKLKMVSNPIAGEGGFRSEWTIKLDPEKAPKEITIDGYKGIYEFDGADIKVAYTVGGERPTDFKAGTGKYYCLLRRVPSEKK